MVAYKMKPLLNKRGQVGLDTGKAVMLALLTLSVLAFAMIVVLTQLNTSSTAVAGAGSTSANQTANILNNVTGGVESFFTNAGTWFALLAIVVIILIVAIVIFAVNRFGGSRGL